MVIVICVLPALFGEDRWRVLCLWIVYRSRSTGCIQWHKTVSSASSQSGCWVITCYLWACFPCLTALPFSWRGLLKLLRSSKAADGAGSLQTALSILRFKCWFHSQRTRLYPCLLCADGASSLETALSVLRQVHMLISRSAYQTLSLLVVCGWCQQSWDSFVRPQTGSHADFTVGLPDFIPASCVRMVPAVLRQLCPSSDRFTCWFHGRLTRLYPCLLCADGASSLETALSVLRQVHVLISWSAYQTLSLLVVCLFFWLFEIPWESEQLKLVSVLCLTLIKFVTLFWFWSLVCWIASTLLLDLTHILMPDNFVTSSSSRGLPVSDKQSSALSSNTHLR